jgi:hypothetical protein
MQIEDIIGKTITNMYSLLSMDVEGMDTYECFIELDSNDIINIPYGLSEDVWQKELNQDAESLFADLSDTPSYHIIYDNIDKPDNAQRRKMCGIFYWLRKMIFGHNVVKDNKKFTVEIEYLENKLKHIKDRKIVDLIWYASDWYEPCEACYLLLDNGYLITETTAAPHGTGIAGLHLFESLRDLTDIRGNDYFKLTDKNTCL